MQQATLLGSDGATEDLLPEMPSNHRIGYRSRSPLSGRETSQSRGTKQYNSAVSPVDTLEQADVAHPLTPSNLLLRSIPEGILVANSKVGTPILSQNPGAFSAEQNVSGVNSSFSNNQLSLSPAQK